jgi:hypothetical protein
MNLNVGVARLIEPYVARQRAARYALQRATTGVLRSARSAAALTMDTHTIFGLFAVTAMLVREDRSPRYVLGFCRRLRARLSLRVSTRRLPLRNRPGHLGACRRAALARKARCRCWLTPRSQRRAACGRSTAASNSVNSSRIFYAAARVRFAAALRPASRMSPLTDHGF